MENKVRAGVDIEHEGKRYKKGDVLPKDLVSTFETSDPLLLDSYILSNGSPRKKSDLGFIYKEDKWISPIEQSRAKEPKKEKPAFTGLGVKSETIAKLSEKSKERVRGHIRDLADDGKRNYSHKKDKKKKSKK